MLTLGLSASCTMDYKPYGSLDENSAIQNLNDLARFRNGVYTALRGMTSGAWVTYQDIQMDQFHGLVSNGNRVGIISNGLITSSDSDLEGFFSACYGQIAKANYLIAKSGEMLTQFTDEEDQATIKRYQGEGQFLRAYAYFFLADHYCQPYAQVDPTAKATGMPIVTSYDPSGDVDKYPSRSTLKETYDLIEKDLADAFNNLKAYEAVDAKAVAPNAAYLSSYAVAAMQARVALVKGDYPTALAKAQLVIGCDKYALTEPADYAKLWSNDEGSEVIFRPFMSSTESPGSTGGDYTASTTQTTADYIPTYATLAAYDDDDIRFDTYFTVWTLDVEGGNYPAYVFLKYPGNEALYTTTENNYCNMPKPFRLSEMYLIAAEAGAKIGTPEATTIASKMLNDLRAKRIDSYTAATIPAVSLMTEVMKERECELLGEGFRMSDLRRWNKGFQRDADHLENPALDGVVVAAGRSMKYEAGDYRFTWPIPKTEMDANPNLKGQQNPGY